MDITPTKAMEEAIKRREKVKRIRNRESLGNQNTESKGYELPKPIFRNFFPWGEDLICSQLPKPKPESVENEVVQQLEAAKPEPFIKEVDLTTLAPSKPDWGLKQVFAKRLDILENKTKVAIGILIRENISSSKEGLARAVNFFTDVVNKAQDSDED